MANFSHWIGAFRLRTLPLALSSILLGNYYAYIQGHLNVAILLLSILTAVLLQILSNLANDYGDFVKGTDSLAERGDRALASGNISKAKMKRALIITSILTLAIGIGLLVVAFPVERINSFYYFLGLGILSIIAAFTYTMGKKAFGYLALGDAVVFIFFGPVAVLGSYYLQHQLMDDNIVNLAIYGGLICTGVLNVNNTRDIETDLKSNKITIANKLGRKTAVVYHFMLILVAFVFFIMASIHIEKIVSTSFVLIFFMAFLLAKHFFAFKTIREGTRDLYNQQLKMLSISYLIFTVLLWIAELIF